MPQPSRIIILPRQPATVTTQPHAWIFAPNPWYVPLPYPIPNPYYVPMRLVSRPPVGAVPPR